MLATALMAPASYAGNMYKWVDTNGRTHYGDRPTHASASQISFAKPAKTTSASPTPTQRDRLQLRRRLLRAYDMERNEKKIAEHRALVKKDKKHIECSNSRNRLANLQSARFLFRTVKGERQVLDDTEPNKYLQTLENSVADRC